jgi:peptide/nickel transport system substrate-binding protein
LPVTTGPWRLAFSSPEQKVIDRAESWWAVDQGLVDALPGVERIIYLPWTEETQMAQQLIGNEIDCSLDLRPLTMETILAQNPAIITHTFSDPPYGYVDWWPTSLYVNNEREPFNDPDVRWALSSFIDRDQVIEVALGGAGSTWPLPLPSYPGLQPFIETISDLLEEYPTLEFNPEKGTALLEGKGWAKNADGIWAKDGTTLDVDIISFAVMADIGPVIAEQLRQQGVNASFAMPPDAITSFQQGDYSASLFGHGGSVSADPYFTLTLYQSRSEAVPGGHQVNFSKWHNDEYDEIVDEMAITPPEDQEALIDQWRRAMEIWLPELPDIPIQEWYHRIPMNTTYWQGWPTRDDPYVNGAFWHLTFQLVLNRLTPTQ